MKRMICLLVLFVFTAGFRVCAQQDLAISEISYSEGVFTIHAETGREEPTRLTVVVLYPNEDGSVKEYTPELLEHAEAFKAMAQFTAVRGKGIFKVEMDSDDADGNYGVFLSAKDGNTVTSSFLYENDMEPVLIAKFLAKLDRANTPAEAEALIKQNQAICGVSLEGAYATLSGTDRAKVCFAVMNKGFTEVDDFRKVWNDTISELEAKQSGSGQSGGKSGSGSTKKESMDFYTDPETVLSDNRKRFSDVGENHWAREYISGLAESGIVSGMGDGSFCPDAPVTRAQAAKILCKAFSVYSESAKSSFDDIEENAWYSAFVGSLQEKGLVNGDDRNCFRPNDEVSRQDMASLVGRVLEFTGRNLPETAPQKVFSDSDTIAAYARDYVAAMQKTGILSGVTEDTFAPLAVTTRAQLCKIIFCAMGLSGS